MKLKHHEQAKEREAEVKEKTMTCEKEKREKEEKAKKKDFYMIQYKQAESEMKAEQERIERLQQDIEQKELSRKEEIDKLYKRETDLYKYKFKIKDLKKSRHVLTHRAKEMQ